MAMVPAGMHQGDLLHQNIVDVLHMMTTEDMQLLLTTPQIWEMMVEELCLEREETDVLRYLLVQEVSRRKEGSVPCGNLSEEEKAFLLDFPMRKYQLERTIEELNAIADQADTTHQMLTKTSLVASSSGAVSAVMTILGAALAPVTAGGSLLLSAAGQGLGAAAAVTNILTSVLDKRSNSAARDRASMLVDSPTLEARAGGRVNLSEVGTAVNVVQRCAGILRSVRQLRAYQMAQTNPGFLARVRNFMATSRVPFWRARGVQSAVQGPALAMSFGARMLSVAGAGFLLMQDMNSIRETRRHLEEGARTEVAEELRTLAQQVEQELKRLSQRYRQIVLRQPRNPEVNQQVRRTGSPGDEGATKQTGMQLDT